MHVLNEEEAVTIKEMRGDRCVYTVGFMNEIGFHDHCDVVVDHGIRRVLVYKSQSFHQYAKTDPFYMRVIALLAKKGLLE